ncbi:MAG: radical SAM protein [Spirochaetia bacterium]|nr:radical SAM protein [Spirochaetia bacterium]
MHKVKAKSILSSSGNMNIYRGCTHGCIYCDSRSRCYNINHDFEDVEIKENALELLEDTLKRKRNKSMIFTGSMSDPYIPIEKDLKLTRGALELVYKYGFGITLLTKSDLILRDLDLIKKINEKTKCVVQMTLTASTDSLSKLIEPNVAPASKRINALKIFSENNIPTIVWLGPILPFILDNEENICALLDMMIKVKVKGILYFGIGMTLREGNREYYYKQLDKLFPNMKEKYIKYYKNNYFVNSFNNDKLVKLIDETCILNNIMHNTDEIFSYLKKFEEKEYVQLSLF